MQFTGHQNIINKSHQVEMTILEFRVPYVLFSHEVDLCQGLGSSDRGSQVSNRKDEEGRRHRGSGPWVFVVRQWIGSGGSVGCMQAA
jgi:hypothetical protein